MGLHADKQHQNSMAGNVQRSSVLRPEHFPKLVLKGFASRWYFFFE
jgi:hypothetical protein